ncbi:hypothetical protein [Armatimonas sp.]|uniref:hypothetical protein n=1 Tax=Armatimonas sp. TaxID=1872638 RepID=UPI00374DAB43
MLTLTNEWIELGEEKGIEKGRVEGRAAEAVLEAADIVRLEAFVERLLEVESWQELLAP